MTDKPHFETLAVRTQTRRSANREHSAPLYLTSSFVFESAEQARAMFADEQPGNIYTRFSNPNTSELADKLCALEGAEDGVALASGMSAVFSTLMALVRAGDHVLSARAVFGSTHQVLTQLLPRWGIETSYADLERPESWEQGFRDNTRLVFVETPSNPGLDLADLAWLAERTRARGALLVVDNCFATPFLQQPLAHGAHLVVHSLTKLIDGQGRGVGGIVVGDRDTVKEIRFLARHSGPTLSPFNAWLFSKSLETLAVRVERQCETALRLAGHLEGHPEVEQVRYPFLPSHPQHDLARRQMRRGGTLVSFVVAGGLERAMRFVDALELASITANLGDTRTIVTHPATTTHARLSEAERRAVHIVPGLVRISAGLEHADDIVADVDRALSDSR